MLEQLPSVEMLWATIDVEVDFDVTVEEGTLEDDPVVLGGTEVDVEDLCELVEYDFAEDVDLTVEEPLLEVPHNPPTG